MALPSVSLRPRKPSGMKRDDKDKVGKNNENYVRYFNYRYHHKLHQ